MKLSNNKGSCTFISMNFRPILVYFFIFLSFKALSQSSKAKMPDFFYQCWAHSYEEDADAVTVSKTYRPCDYKDFKPSMYRHRIEFYRNGKCKTLQMAPNDAHFFAEASWEYNKGNVTVRNDKKEVILKFKIKSLKNNRLDMLIKKFN